MEHFFLNSWPLFVIAGLILLNSYLGRKIESSATFPETGDLGNYTDDQGKQHRDRAIDDLRLDKRAVIALFISAIFLLLILVIWIVLDLQNSNWDNVDGAVKCLAALGSLGLLRSCRKMYNDINGHLQELLS